MNDTHRPPLDDDAPETFFREIQVEFLIHEMKDPLSVVETGLRSLLERRQKYGELTPRQEKTLQRSLRNTRKAREMLYGLLEVGRSQAGCVTPSRFRVGPAVVDVIGDCMEMIANGPDGPPELGDDMAAVTETLARQAIHLDLSDVANLELNQDKVKFRQILSNLIRNGLHHRRNRLAIHLYREGDLLRGEITDDGPGIAPRHQDMIFERYAQVETAECDMPSRRGHGLGLAGARIMARTLDGDIGVQSDGGAGATFRLTLPMTLNR